VFVIPLLLLPRPAEAIRNPVTTCQFAIDKAAFALVQAAIRAEQACLKKLARGRLPAETQCIGQGGSVAAISDASTRDKILSALTKSRRMIDKHCDGVDLLAPPT
jgi:hypothetical protein